MKNKLRPLLENAKIFSHHLKPSPFEVSSKDVRMSWHYWSFSSHVSNCLFCYFSGITAKQFYVQTQKLVKTLTTITSRMRLCFRWTYEDNLFPDMHSLCHDKRRHNYVITPHMHSVRRSFVQEYRQGGHGAGGTSRLRHFYWEKIIGSY